MGWLFTASIMAVFISGSVGVVYPNHKLSPMVWITGVVGWLVLIPIPPMLMSIFGYTGPDWHFVAAGLAAYAIPVCTGAAIILRDEVAK